jgi:hypothetical protein
VTVIAPPSPRLHARWPVAALLVTLAVSTLLLVLLLAGGQEPDIIVTLAVPVLICALPFAVPGRHRRRAMAVSAALLAGGVVLGLLSIGIYYVPSVILLAVGATREGRRPSPVTARDPAG